MKRVLLILLFSLIIFDYSYSQNSQLKLSKLGDQVYFEQNVKYLTDEYLFESMDLNLPGLEKVKESVAMKDYRKAYTEWGKYWQLKKKPDAVIDLEDQLVSRAEFLKNCNEKNRNLIFQETEKIMRNEINGWGLTTIKFDSIIDFNANYGESGKYGFNYFIWSKPLYLARLFDDNIKYTKKYDEIFSQWYDQRYRVTGIYKEWDIIYYELGLGARNRFFLCNYTFDNPERNWIIHEKMLKTMLGSGNWYYQMESNEPYTYENRQLVAIANMGMLGLYFPEFKESKKWIELAYEKTLEHLDKDFLPDGANVERSPWGYTSLTYNCIRNFYYSLKENGYEQEKLRVIKNKLIRTINWWLSVLTPNGDMLASNDGHRRTFPYSMFTDAIELYGLKENMGILASIYNLDNYKNFPLPNQLSINLDKSEFAVMRNSWQRDANYMSINYSGWSGGHSHYNILDFDIYAFGKALSVDPGIGWTYDDTLHFTWYKKSISHNMIIVNDSNINKKEAKAENAYWMSNNKYDYFSAEEKKGYSRFDVKYKRHFIFIKPDIWLVYDKVYSGNENNKITWNIHLRGGINKIGNYYKSYHDSGLVVCPAEDYASEIKSGRAMIKYDKLPDDFEELAWLRFKQQGRGEMNFCSMIYPYTNNRNNLVLYEKDPGSYLIKDGEKEIKIIFGEASGLSEKIKSDAEVIILTGSKNSKRNIQIINGSFLNINGKEYIRENKKWNYMVNN